MYRYTGVHLAPSMCLCGVGDVFALFFQGSNMSALYKATALLLVYSYLGTYFNI